MFFLMFYELLCLYMLMIFWYSDFCLFWVEGLRLSETRRPASPQCDLTVRDLGWQAMDGYGRRSACSSCRWPLCLWLTVSTNLLEPTWNSPDLQHAAVDVRNAADHGWSWLAEVSDLCSEPSRALEDMSLVALALGFLRISREPIWTHHASRAKPDAHM